MDGKKKVLQSADTHQIVTHTSCTSGQMDVISQFTLQVLFPVQLVARSSQNLHSFFIFTLEDSGKKKGIREIRC